MTETLDVSMHYAGALPFATTMYPPPWFLYFYRSSTEEEGGGSDGTLRYCTLQLFVNNYIYILQEAVQNEEEKAYEAALCIKEKVVADSGHDDEVPPVPDFLFAYASFHGLVHTIKK